MKRKYRKTLESIAELEEVVFSELLEEEKSTPEAQYKWVVCIYMLGGGDSRDYVEAVADTKEEAMAFKAKLESSEEEWIRVGEYTSLRRQQVSRVDVYRQQTQYCRGVSLVGDTL